MGPAVVNPNLGSDEMDETCNNISSVFQTPDAPAPIQARTLLASSADVPGRPRGIAPRILGGNHSPSTRRPVLSAIFTKNSSMHLARLSEQVSPGDVVQYVEVLRSCLERGLEIVESLGSQPACWNGESGETGVDLLESLDVSAGDFMRNARAKNKRYCIHTQRNLFRLRHAGGCGGHQGEGACKADGCGANRQLWTHLKHCSDTTCKYPRCMYASWELAHLKGCRDLTCSICGPVQSFILRSKECCMEDGRHSPPRAAASSTGGLSGEAKVERALAALTDRLGGMVLLREGTSRSDEDDELAQALMGVAIDPSAPPRAPTVSLRGGGGGSFSLGGAVSQAIAAQKIHGADNIAKRLAAESATHNETEAEDAKRRNPFSTPRRRISTMNRSEGGEMNDRRGDNSTKRGGGSTLPMWRTGSTGDNADAFRRSIGLGIRCGTGPNNTWSAERGDGTEDAHPATASDGDKEIPAAAIWDETMGEAPPEGVDGGVTAAQLGGADIASGDRPAAHIQTRILAKRDSVVNDQSKLLVLLHHVYSCQASGNGENCKLTTHCTALRRTWRHVRNCSSPDCSEHLCGSVTSMLVHANDCSTPGCSMCAPLRALMQQGTFASGFCA